VAKREKLLQAHFEGEIRRDLRWHETARRSTDDKMAEA